VGLLKFLTVVLILLFPLGELGRINIYNEVSVTINDLLVGLLVSVWLISNIFVILVSPVQRGASRISNVMGDAGQASMTNLRLAKPILILIFIAFLSLLFNINSLRLPEFLVSFLYLLRFVAYAGIYFIVSGFDIGFKRKILALMIFSGTLIVLGGFVQYFFYPNLRNLYYLGWDEHLYRLFGSFLDPNFAASIISLFLVLILSMLFSRHFGPLRPRSEASLSRVSKRLEILDEPFGLTGMTQMVFLVLLSISAFIALLLTYSRSGYLMFFVSAVSLLLILGKKKYVVVLLLMFVIGIIFLPKNLGGEGVKLLRTASLISRSQYLNNAIVIFKDHPVLGVGFNTYRYAQRRYGFIDDISLKTSHAGSGTDNSFLFVLATTGIVGFTFYLYMWIRILKSCHPEVVSGFRSSGVEMLKRVQHDKREERFQKIISIVIISSSTGLFVNAFFLNSLFYPSVMLWMWVLVGLNENKN